MESPTTANSPIRFPGEKLPPSANVLVVFEDMPGAAAAMSFREEIEMETGLRDLDIDLWNFGALRLPGIGIGVPPNIIGANMIIVGLNFAQDLPEVLIECLRGWAAVEGCPERVLVAVRLADIRHRGDGGEAYRSLKATAETAGISFCGAIWDSGRIFLLEVTPEHGSGRKVLEEWQPENFHETRHAI